MDKSKLNDHFQHLDVDYLYHLGLDSSMNLEEQFNDTKYVILTRSFADADYFANKFTESYYGMHDVHINCKTIAKDERYHIYKVGNTLIISHGVGSPSMLICLNEIVKLLWHAKANDYQFIRLSPGGGIGVDENNIVISHSAVNQQLQPEWSNIEFGEYHTYSTEINDSTTKRFISINDKYNLVTGKILSTLSFYNGQARLNGAIPVTYTEQESNQYLQSAYNIGVRGIDMESGCFLAFCKNFDIPATVVLAVLANRLKAKDRIEPSLSFDDQNMEIGIKNASKAIIEYILNDSKRGVECV